jgi:hypothetical protein
MSVRRRLSILTIAMLMVGIAWQPALAWQLPVRIDNFGNSQDPTTSVVVAPNGATFVAFARRGSDELYWAKRTLDGWRRTTVTGQDTFTLCYDPDNPAIGPSAAFAPDGSPRIASACIAVGGGAKIQYSSRAGGHWTTEMVGYGPSGTGTDSSATTMALAMSPAGRPWIVFTDDGTKDITRFRLVKGKWQRQQLIRGVSVCCGNQGKMVDAATNPSTGMLGVAWTNRFEDEGVLAYAEFNGRGDLVGDIEDISFGTLGAFGRPSLAYRSNGDPAIAVQQSDGVTRAPALALRTGGVWAVHTIDDSVANAGLHPSLDITGDVFRVAYPDDTNADLRYASSTDGVVWSPMTAVGPGDVGDVPAIAVSGAGVVTIAYYDTGRTALRSVTGP